MMVIFITSPTFSKYAIMYLVNLPYLPIPRVRKVGT